jgi:hypothetical protein
MVVRALLQVVLLDSLAKRCQFLRAAAEVAGEQAAGEWGQALLVTTGCISVTRLLVCTCLPCSITIRGQAQIG